MIQNPEMVSGEKSTKWEDICYHFWIAARGGANRYGMIRYHPSSLFVEQVKSKL